MPAESYSGQRPICFAIRFGSKKLPSPGHCVDAVKPGTGGSCTVQELVLSRTAAGLVVFCWSAVSWAQATPTVVQWVEIFQEVRQHLMFNGLDIRYSKALAKNVGYTPIGVVLNEGFGCAVVIAEGENPKMPVVLSREEVSRLIAAAWNLKHQTALAVAYGTGLRASEVIALKVGDIDSQRMTLRIEQGKGRKDRYPVICRLHQSYRAP